LKNGREWLDRSGVKKRRERTFGLGTARGQEVIEIKRRS